MNIFYGVDYYPEHWPRERWETDIQLMKEMGLDVVRLAEFSWSKLEPSKGEFNFGWLDEVIDLMEKSGIKCILGTPSAAAPAWIIAENPEIQPIDDQGRQRFFGGRHHNCQSNKVYREHIKRYVSAFAGHFSKKQNVIGWQVDNELGNSHNNLCFCPSCEASFQSWLKNKYGDIDTLNKKWGTVFWSQNYQDFSQIQAPKLTAAGKNPSSVLDWKRFCSDLLVDFHKFQSRILRAASPDKFITHNYMGFADKVNYFDLGEDQEFVSLSQYPGGHFHPDQNSLKADQLAAALDLMRATKQQSFWIMEQQSGITGWEILGRAPRPGELGMWAMQSVAHGADTIVFFRWRTCTVGTEQYWHGILPHSGIPGRNYQELKSLIHKTKPLMKELQGSLPNSKVGIIFSYDQSYAIDIQPHHPDMNYVDHLMRYYTALFNRNVPVDFVSDKADFGNYDLLIAPLQYIMPDELESKYRDYVVNGGNLVMDIRAGVKDENNICRTEAALPGKILGEVLGISIPEYDCLRDVCVKVLWDGIGYEGEKWCDIIELNGAAGLAVYDSEFYAGTPVVTINSYGKGKAYYVGTEPGGELAGRIVEELIARHGLANFGFSPLGVEIVHRACDEKEFIFVINHTKECKSVDIPADWKPYFEGQSDELRPFAVDVYVR